MGTSNILITSATGNVGTPLAKALQKKDIHFTAATRKPVAAKEKFNAPLETVYLDFQNVPSFVPALEEKDILFLCGPSATPGAENLLMPLLEEAKQQNVKHVVFIASYPKVMDAIKESGMDYTFIKANFFMQNFEMYQTEDIRDKNQIFLPVGEGKAPFIHTKDIGEVAAEIIEKPEDYHGKTVYITGPQAMDHFQAADVFSEVLGRTITFQNPDEETYRKEMKARGYSDTYINAMIAVFGKIKQGLVAQTSERVKEILGREPVNLKEYVEERKSRFE